MSEQLVAAFSGPVACSVRHRQLTLSGRERGSGRPLRVYLGGFDAAAPSTSYVDAEFLEQRSPDGVAWRLRAVDQDLLLKARSVHVHRPAAEQFFAAVPGAERTLTARLGWALLLNVLRVPGAARFLAFLRSR
jgi:hypothetical protein